MSQSKSLLSQTEVDNYSHISNNELNMKAKDNQLAMIRILNNLSNFNFAERYTVMPKHMDFLQHGGAKNELRESKSLDKLQDLLAQRSPKFNGNYDLQAYSEDRRKQTSVDNIQNGERWNANMDKMLDE